MMYPRRRTGTGMMRKASPEWTTAPWLSTFGYGFGDQLDSRLDGFPPPDRCAPASAPAPALQLVDTRPGPDREQRARPCGETHLLTDLIAVWEGAHERVGAV